MRDKIAILDVDGILLDICSGAIKYVKEKHGASITEDDITDWDWDYCLGLPEGMTDELWEYIWGTPARVYPGAHDFIQDLKDKGYFVQGLSTRFDHSKGSKAVNGLAAAERDFAQFDFDDYTLKKNKAQWILDNMPDADFIVEDYNKNAVEIGTKTNIDVYFMTRPWNEKCISVTGAWKRVYSYKDIMFILDTKNRTSYFS